MANEDPESSVNEAPPVSLVYPTRNRYRATGRPTGMMGWPCPIRKPSIVFRTIR